MVVRNKVIDVAIIGRLSEAECVRKAYVDGVGLVRGI